MKNIETILGGYELDENTVKEIADAVKENYKPVADYQKQVEKIKSLEETVETTQKALEEFKDVKPEELQKTITDLKKTIEENEGKYKAQLADRDFNDTLKEAIGNVKGKNVKAIMALLDVDSLKASKNQKDDIEKALKDLTEAEDSSMLFGDVEKPAGTGAPIGRVGKGGSNDDLAAMRRVMGLPDKE